MSARTFAGKSLIRFCIWEFVLSLPFWGWIALAHAGLVPNLQMLNAAWSLTPMMAAAIIVYGETRGAGLREFFKRCFDAKRIERKIWFLPILLLEPAIVAVQYAVARASVPPPPAPQFTWLVPVAYIAEFFGVFGEELGWTAFALDRTQERWSSLKASLFVGVLWATFHAPVWVLSRQSLYWCAWQYVYVVATRILFAWLYNNSGRSLFAMGLVHPGMGIYWYLWPVSADLGLPSFYDPRTLAYTALVLAALVVVVWGPNTLARFRFSKVRADRASIGDWHREALD